MRPPAAGQRALRRLRAGGQAGPPRLRDVAPRTGAQRPAPEARMRLRAVRAGGAPLWSLARRLLRPELLLGVGALLAVLAPVVFRPPRAAPLSLPEAEGSALLQYLVPEQTPPAGEAAGAAIGTLRLSSYALRPGDTLSGVAQRFGLSMDTVISFNGIQDARALRAGTVLSLPNASGLKYRVRRGDSLGGIAARFRVPLNDLLDWNSLESSVIVPGQDLFLPGARLSEHDLDRVFGRLFILPTRGRFSSRFGVRGDPFTGMTRFHNGVDLAGSTGTPVVAAMSGKVSMAGYNPNYGRYIILSHAEGFQTLYGHLDSFQVRRGARVKQGELIGLMGNSGYSTGSHLHFAIFLRGEPVDPARYLH